MLEHEQKQLCWVESPPFYLHPQINMRGKQNKKKKEDEFLDGAW